MRDAVIVSAVRTAVGKAPRGTLKDTRPDEMGAVVIREAIARVEGLEMKEIEDVIMGCAMPEAEQGMNVTRAAAIRAGLPVETSAMTINRFCSSGLQSIALAADKIRTGGAAAAVVMSDERAKQLGIKPLARFLSYATAGCPPEEMGIGPVFAIPKALKLAGLTLAEIDLIELNEAFAAQSLAVIKTLGLDPERVNVNGGAIALGHPLGCTGAKLTASILRELERRGGRYAMVTMCVGGGMGAAGIFERMA